MALLRAFGAALVFLTRVPVPWVCFSTEDWRRAPAHFPLVGAGLGLLLAGVWTVLGRIGPLGAATVVVTVSLLVTGALHEDGLADSADALGGGKNREHVLAILKDSRIGAFGAVALVSALLLRVVLLARLAELAPTVLVATECAARVPLVWLLVRLPYVTGQEHAKSALLARAGQAQAVVASLWLLLVLGLLRVGGRIGYREPLVVLGVAVLATLLGGLYLRARVGGVTGDLLGGLEQVTQCAMLLGWALLQEDAAR